ALSSSFLYFFLMLHRLPLSTLFPYTTLFRSNILIKTSGPTIIHSAIQSQGHIYPSPFIKAPFKRFVFYYINHFPGSISLFVDIRSEEHTSELQSRENLVCRLLLEKKKIKIID